MAEKENIQIQIDAAVKSAEAAKSLGELRKSLLGIQELQAQLGDQSGPQFDKLTQASAQASAKLAETRDKIGDIQDKTRTLEGTPVERLTGSFGLLKDSIMNLDFDKAKIGLEGLTNAFTPVVDGKLVSGFAGIKGALGSLGEGVKSLGSTFMSVGKALLTNPIFLLAAAIAAIVAIVIVVMDKLGILKKVIDALMIPINAVIKGFEMLTDWLGLTTNAQNEAAAAAKKNGEAQRKEIDATATKQKAYAQLTSQMTDDEIKAFAKKAGIRDDFNKSSFDIEKERLDATNETLANEISALEAIQEAGGELTDEQKADLDKRRADYEANANQIKILEAQKLAAIETMNQKTTATLESWQIKNIANKNERDKAQLKVEEANEVRKIDIQIAEAKRLGADTKALEATKAEIKKFYANSEVEINKAIYKQQQAIATEATNKKKEAALKELKDLEDQNALSIAKTKEGTKERVKAEQDAIDKILKLQKDKQTILSLSNATIQRLEIEAVEKKTKLQDEYDLKVQKSTRAQTLLEKENAVERAKTDIELYQTKRDLVITQAQFDLEDAKTKAEREKVQNEAAKKIREMDAEFFAKERADDLLRAQTKASQLESELTQEGLAYETRVGKLRDFQKAKIDLAAVERDQALADENLTEAQKDAIKESYRQKEYEANRELTDKLKELNKERFDNYTQIAQNTITAFQGLSDLTFAIGKANNKRTEEEQEKSAKRQFEINKGIQIASAVISTITGVVNALTAKTVVPEPMGSILKAANAIAVGIAGAANIAKIEATRYTSKSSSTTVSSTPSSGGGGGEAGGGMTGTAPTTLQPNQFFGLGQTTPGGTPMTGGVQKVYVVESDITAVQDRVKVIESRAVLK